MSTSPKCSDHRITFAVLLVATMSYSLLQSLVLPVLPTLQRDLHTSQDTVTWVLTAYLVSASIFTPLLGRLGDMVGKERMLVVTLTVLGLGIVMAGLSNSIWLLIIARSVQGIGGAVVPLSFGIVRDELPAKGVPGAVGIIAALLAVGGGVGIVLAGPIVNTLGVHWLFWIPLFMVVTAAIAAKLFVPESPVRTPGRINWWAAALLAGWLVALLVAVSEAQSWGWTSRRVVVLAAVAVVFGIAWVLVELRSRSPLIDMRMMRQPAVWTTNLVAFMFGAGMFSIIAFLPEFVQTPKSAGYGFGASIVQSGLFLLPMTITMFLFGLLSGRIAATIGSKSALIIGSIASAACYLMLAFAHDLRWEIYAASTLLGIGLGLAFSAMSNLIVLAVPPAQTGVASGMNANIRTVGGAIGAAVMSSIVASEGLKDGFPAESGYTRGFIFLAAMTVVAAMFIPSTPNPEADPVIGHHLEHAELAIVPSGTLIE